MKFNVWCVNETKLLGGPYDPVKAQEVALKHMNDPKYSTHGVELEPVEEGRPSFLRINWEVFQTLLKDDSLIQ